jgi:hypothetical protein
MILGTNRHRSKPDHPTPWNFMSAVTLGVGDVAIDLAATMKDRKAEGFISPKENSLKQDWTKLLNGELGYLNPPFDPGRPERTNAEKIRGCVYKSLALK